VHCLGRDFSNSAGKIAILGGFFLFHQKNREYSEKPSRASTENYLFPTMRGKIIPFKTAYSGDITS
jgi:hypothetical protein